MGFSGREYWGGLPFSPVPSSPSKLKVDMQYRLELLPLFPSWHACLSLNALFPCLTAQPQASTGTAPSAWNALPVTAWLTLAHPRRPTEGLLFPRSPVLPSLSRPSVYWSPVICLMRPQALLGWDHWLSSFFLFYLQRQVHRGYWVMRWEVVCRTIGTDLLSRGATILKM